MNMETTKDIKKIPVRRLRFFGDPILTTPTTEEKFDDPGRMNIQIRRMVDAMHHYGGIGLAANQVGYENQICVFDTTLIEDEVQGNFDDGNVLVMINPKLSDQTQPVLVDEGCLSFPGIDIRIYRPESVKATYQGIDGTEQEITATSVFSQAVCHEVEHLEGKLFIKNLSHNQRSFLKSKLRKIKKLGESVYTRM